MSNNEKLGQLLVTEEEKNEIKKNSPEALPLNPTAQGYSGQEIRRMLGASITGKKGSVLNLIEKKMEVIKEHFETGLVEVDDELASTVKTEEDPTEEDNNYPIGTHWVNTDTEVVYVLVKVDDGIAVWKDVTNQSVIDYIGEEVIEKIEEVIRVEQKVDAHIEDLNNPHAVTAEQVDTYVKTTIDLKDANTLQEAKDYTDSQVKTDDKTITRNDDQELEVNLKYIMNGGYL